MNFETKRKVENNVFSVNIVFTEFGTEEMDENREKALFDDLGFPSINLGNITFEGEFDVDGDKRVIDAEAGSGDKVSFVVNAKKLILGPGFSTSYSVDARDIASSELGSKLNTNRLVAEAKCLLFQEKVLEAIENSVTKLKAERTRFETEVVETLTV